MSTDLSTLPTELRRFRDTYGEELDTCNPAALDLLNEVISSPTKELLDDFVWYYLDELDACQPDAFDMLSSIMDKFGIDL